MSVHYYEGKATYHGCVQSGRTRTASGETWNRVCYAHSGHRSAREVAE